MELIQQCYSYLFWGVLVALALCVVAVLVYILKAHLTVDRIIGINLIGTLVVIVICALTYLLGEDYLADIAVIYVVMSFIGKGCHKYSAGPGMFLTTPGFSPL